MKLTLFSVAILIFALVLSGCNPQFTPLIPGAISIGDPSLPPTHTPIAKPATSGFDMTPEKDGQGEISVDITPLNLNDAPQSIEFKVALETHSIDLGMDLAKMATLTIDNGAAIPALKWDAPRGGHHVSGTLSFPTEINGLKEQRK
jgi:hypothetical protein